MAQSKLVMRGFLIAAVLFMFAALIPFVRGGTVNTALVPVGLACLVVVATMARKGRAGSGSP